MLIQNGLTSEFMLCVALGFLAPVRGDWSRQRRKTAQRMWPWVLLFGAMALSQVATAIFYPDIFAEAYPLM